MPLAPDVLLQVNVAKTARTSAASNAFKPAETSKDEASSFSNVYANQSSSQSRDKPVADREVRDVPARPAREKVAADKDKPVSGKDKPSQADKAGDDKDQVAESGNPLPAKSVAAASGADDKSKGADKDEQQASDDAALEQQQALVTLLPVSVEPALDPAIQQVAAAALPVAAPVELPTVATDAPGETSESAQDAVALVAASLPVTVAPAPAAPSANAAASEEAFDPEVDPLEGLHALQFALESAGGKGRTAAQPASTPQDNPVHGRADNDPARAQAVVNNLANLGDQGAAQDGATESSDQSFTAVLGDGLKDTKSAASDTRVDNFAERLAALSQAAQPARAAPAAPMASPLGQPLAMHQSGWSEGIVERVMYLSSQNLKSAEIKLEPAELGRLDIRVNMAPDQQTQVTFVSAHIGVRDALESQVTRLRESFNQQGLGQVDVNVSDQSQQQAQQQAQEQASRAQRGGGRGALSAGDVQEDVMPEAAVAVSQPAQRVIGSSEIDYYA